MKQSWSEIHRQVVLVEPTATGRRVLVTWLPAKGLRIGLRIDSMTVTEVFDLPLRRCAVCQKLCGMDTVRCLCQG